MMTEFDMYIENIGRWKKTSWSLIMVALMMFSLFAGMNVPASKEIKEDWADSIDRSPVQTQHNSQRHIFMNCTTQSKRAYLQRYKISGKGNRFAESRCPPPDGSFY